MQTLLIVIHVLVCFFLIVIVLLQHGKGADMGATFGGASQTVFGTEGPLPLLNKITTGAAIVFMVTSVALAYVSSNMGNGTVMRDVQAPAATEQPAETTPSAIPLPPAGQAGDAPLMPARSK